MFLRLDSTGWAPGQQRCQRQRGSRSAVGELVALGRRAAIAPRLGQDLNGTAGGGDGCLGRLRERVGLDRDGSAELAPPEDLDEGALVGEARPCRTAGLTSVSPASSRTSRLMPWYSTRNGLLKPLSFGIRCGAASGRPRSRSGPCCGPSGPWCRGRRSCRPCRRCRGRRASCAWFEPGAGFRSWIFIGSAICYFASSTVMRCGTRASMPRISGRSGRVLVLPMRPQAERPEGAAVLGLGADGRLDLGR